MSNLFRTIGEGRKRRARAAGAPAARIQVPLCGREGELSLLLEGAARASAGRPAFSVVSGEPGIGKTRLMQEVARRCRGLGVRAFLLPPPEGATPFSGLRKLVEDLTKVYLPGKERRGMPPTLQALLDGDPQALTEQAAIHGAIQAFLRSLGNLAPIYILIDDFPEFDPQSRDAFFYLTRVWSEPRSPARVSLAFAGPPDEVADDPERAFRDDVLSNGAQSIVLDRLQGPEVEAMVQGSFPGQEVDARLSPLILKQSQGNPLFAISLIEMLLADGVLAAEEGYVRLQSARDPDLPDSVVDLILRQLQTLAEKEQRLLALGSVSGVVLEPEFLTRGLGWGRAETLAVLKKLAASGRMVRAAQGHFEFDPAAAQQVIYEELADTARVRFHELRARHLEQTRGTHPELALDIASHLDRAGISTQAAVYYLLGGRYLRENFAWDLARHCYERYLSIILTGTPERAEALLGASEALLELGRLSEAEPLLEEATALAEKLALPAFRGQAIMLTARRLFLLGESRSALVAARLAEEIFEPIGEEASLARVVELKGDLLMRTGSVEEAELALEASLLLLTKADDPRARAGILLKLALVARETCRFDRALHYIGQALDTARDLGDHLKEATVVHQAGLTRWMQGERPEGLDLIREGVRLCQKHAHPMGEADSLADLAYALGEEGDLPAAIAAATQSRDLWHALGEKPGEARAHAILASAYGQKGPVEQARAFGGAAYMVLDEVGDLRTKAWVLAILARVAEMTADVELAQKLATESLGLAERLDDHVTSGLALGILGSTLLDRDSPGEARDLLERAVTDLKAAHAVTHLPRIRAALGRALCHLGDSDGGLTLLQDSISDADEMGSSTARAETMMELGRSMPQGSPESQLMLESAREVAASADLQPLVTRIESLLAQAETQ